MVNKENSSYSKRLLHLISWGHWFTFFNIGAAIIIALIFLNSEGIPDGVIGKFYMFTNWFSHMAFLTFICFVLTVFPLTLLFPRTNFIRGAASVIFTLALTLLALDGFTYSQLGYHLNVSSSTEIINLLIEQLRHNSISFTWRSTVIVLSILVFQLIMSNYAWKHLRSLQKLAFARFAIYGLVGTFFISHVIHVWADVNLEYEVLRQDRVLPFSYPSTAKTMLTKYGLFDQQDYEQRKNLSFDLKDKIPSYPNIDQQCLAETPEQSVIVVLNNQLLTQEQLNRFNANSVIKGSQLVNYVDNANSNDAWFNLMYSLPTIYQNGVLKQNVTPVLYQAITQLGLVTSITTVSNETNSNVVPEKFSSLFDQTTHIADITELVHQEKLNNLAPGVHVVYFADQDDFQYELFVNALLLAQKSKPNKDILWFSSLGNVERETGFNNKPALLIWPNKQDEIITELASPMDLQPTLMRYWLKCRTKYVEYGNGKNLYRLKNDRIIANTAETGLMIFKKDKAVFIDHQGNFESYSSQLETLISESSNFPLLIDGVKNLNQFSTQNLPK